MNQLLQLLMLVTWSQVMESGTPRILVGHPGSQKKYPLENK